MSLMLDPGDHRITFDELRNVPVPKPTQTWFPVSWADIIQAIRDRCATIYGQPLSEEFGLSKNRRQFFSVITYSGGRADTGIAVGARGSYDQSLANGVVAGSSVFVCSNLCFSGEHLEVLRKNTKNAWRDIQAMLEKTIGHSAQAYEQLNADLDLWREKPLTDDEAYATVGQALGHGIVGPRQAMIALRDWQVPRHEEFRDKNAYSLYNDFTESAKVGAAGQRIQRQAGMHEFFQGLFDRAEITRPAVTVPDDLEPDDDDDLGFLDDAE